jgi:hypothetical protein
MLNMMAMPASRGSSRATYNWEQAVTYAEPQVIKQDLDYWVAEGADYDDLVDFAYQERLARVQAAIPPDHHHVLHGIDGIQHGLLREKATENVMAALERYEVAQAERLANFGVQYRSDTSPELAELLGVDLYSIPRLDDLKHLLSGETSDGQQPEGKRRYQTKGERNTMGSLELTFSTDKSVSVVFGLSSRRGTPGDCRAHRRTAVDVAMHQLGNKA